MQIALPERTLSATLILDREDRLTDDEYFAFCAANPAQKKMRVWMANGVEPGWLIDGDARRVYVYRGTSEPRLVADAESIAGEGPVEGFVLPLGEIWEGL